MDRVTRILETTDLLTEAQAITLFNAADVSHEALKAAVEALSQYGSRRRKRIFRVVRLLQHLHSASLSPSGSLSPSASASASV